MEERNTKFNSGRFKKGQIISEKTRQAVSLAQKGKPKSLETRKKMSDSNPWKGKKRPEVSELHRGNKYGLGKKKDLHGEKNPNWKGGIHFIKRSQGIYNSQRRARKRNSIGSYSLKEWENLKAQYNWTCPCCKKQEPEIKLGADHIIPLSKGGSDNIENIQPLCKPCNSRKSNKIIPKYE